MEKDTKMEKDKKMEKDLYTDASEALDIRSNHVRSQKTSLLLWLVYNCIHNSRFRFFH